MRITNALVTRETITRLGLNSERLQEAQERVSSGLKLKTISDDPVAGAQVMETSSALRGITQFKRNAQSIGSELDAEDTALGSVTDLLTRAKELAISQAGATANATTRTATAAEVKQLIGQAVMVGNTKVGDAFLFGGANSSNVQPFDVNQTTQPPLYVAVPAGQTAPVAPQGGRRVEVAPGQTVGGAHDGNSAFVTTGVLSSLKALYDGLVNNDAPAIQASSTGIDGAIDAVQALVGDVGARRNQIDAVQAGLGASEANLTQVKSDLSEVDMEQAITEMVSRQTAYQAAMMASSKVMGMSLADYLK